MAPGKQKKKDRQLIYPSHKIELNNRLENYANNPDDLLDWQEIKKDW